MQWKPMKEYQAPAYLAKAATLLAATTLLNGCGNLPVTPVDPPQSGTTATTEAMFEGALTTPQPTTTEPVLDGDIIIPQETTTILEGTFPVSQSTTTTTTEPMLARALTTPQPTTTTTTEPMFEGALTTPQPTTATTTAAPEQP